MRILISNDDGVTAPGIAALHAALKDYAECVVIAPDQDKSGAGSSLTLDRPLHPQTLANGFISLNGTPTDCVHLGLNGLLPDPIDLVVSGINLGANLGDDVIYSGTVAAALEGRFLGGTSLAFSLVSRSPDNLPSAAHIARRLVEALPRLHLPPRTVLNVNIPNLPLAHIRGIQLTPPGRRRRPRWSTRAARKVTGSRWLAMPRMAGRAPISTRSCRATCRSRRCSSTAPSTTPSSSSTVGWRACSDA